MTFQRKKLWPPVKILKHLLNRNASYIVSFGMLNLFGVSVVVPVQPVCAVFSLCSNFLQCKVYILCYRNVVIVYVMERWNHQSICCNSEIGILDLVYWKFIFEVNVMTSHLFILMLNMFMMLNRILFYPNKIVKSGLVYQTCSTPQISPSSYSCCVLTNRLWFPIHPLSGEMSWCPEKIFWNSQMSCFRFHRFLICITAVMQFFRILLWW